MSEHEVDRLNAEWKARGGVPAETVQERTGGAVTLQEALDGPDLSVRETTVRDRNKLKRMLKEMRATAKAATKGRWRRDHGVVTASDKDGAMYGTTICFAEVDVESLGSGYAGWLKREPMDRGVSKPLANSRHIVATQPEYILAFTALVAAALGLDLED